MKVIKRSDLSARLDKLPDGMLGAAISRLSPELCASAKVRKLLNTYQAWKHGQKVAGKEVSRVDVEDNLAWAMGYNVIDEGA